MIAEEALPHSLLAITLLNAIDWPKASNAGSVEATIQAFAKRKAAGLAHLAHQYYCIMKTFKWMVKLILGTTQQSNILDDIHKSEKAAGY